MQSLFVLSDFVCSLPNMWEVLKTTLHKFLFVFFLNLVLHHRLSKQTEIEAALEVFKFQR